METFGRQSIEDQTISKPALRTKPRWVQPQLRGTHEMIKMLSDLRHQWFVAYSEGGGSVKQSGYKDRLQCAKNVVTFSHLLLEAFKVIGRTKIAEGGTPDGVAPPTCDKEWEVRIKQKYSLYLSVDELLSMTQNIQASRWSEEDKIPVGELVG